MFDIPRLLWYYYCTINPTSPQFYHNTIFDVVKPLSLFYLWEKACGTSRPTTDVINVRDSNGQNIIAWQKRNGFCQVRHLMWVIKTKKKQQYTQQPYVHILRHNKKSTKCLTKAWVLCLYIATYYKHMCICEYFLYKQMVMIWVVVLASIGCVGNKKGDLVAYSEV